MPEWPLLSLPACDKATLRQAARVGSSDPLRAGCAGRVCSEDFRLPDNLRAQTETGYRHYLGTFAVREWPPPRRAEPRHSSAAVRLGIPNIVNLPDRSATLVLWLRRMGQVDSA